LDITKQDCVDLLELTRRTLKPTWTWLMKVVDSTESQLRYGQALALYTNQNHPDHPKFKAPGNNGGSSSGSSGSGGRSAKKPGDRVNHRDEVVKTDNLMKQDFLSYLLSLMRSHSDEHSGLLPAVDVSALRHVAYVLDAYVCVLRGFSFPPASMKITPAVRIEQIYMDGSDDNEDNIMGLFGEDPRTEEPSGGGRNTNNVFGGRTAPAEVLAQPQRSFFRRSNSMSFVAGSESDPFEHQVDRGIPLAAKPHLLQLNARKEELFGRPPRSSDSLNASVKLGLSRRVVDANEVEFSDNDYTANAASFAESQLESAAAAETPMDVDFGSATTAVGGSGSAAAATSGPSASNLNTKGEGAAKTPATPSRKKCKRDNAALAAAAAAAAAASPWANTPSAHSRKRLRRRAEFEDSSGPQALATSGAPLRKRPKKSIMIGNSSSADIASEEKVEVIGGFLEANADTPSIDSILGRCRLGLELFSRVFLDSVGAEPKSILYEHGGFSVRESKFRKEMENSRSTKSDDFNLTVDRERNLLIAQTFKQLNQHCKRRQNAELPLSVVNVKVTFSNEPGEGTGVARSFYTAIAEALLKEEPLPNLDSVTATGKRGRVAGELVLTAEAFFPKNTERLGAHDTSSSSAMEPSKQVIGERLFQRIQSTRNMHNCHPNWIPKITGIFLSKHHVLVHVSSAL